MLNCSCREKIQLKTEPLLIHLLSCLPITHLLIHEETDSHLIEYLLIGLRKFPLCPTQTFLQAK